MISYLKVNTYIVSIKLTVSPRRPSSGFIAVLNSLTSGMLSKGTVLPPAALEVAVGEMNEWSLGKAVPVQCRLVEQKPYCAWKAWALPCQSGPELTHSLH